ncbi:hypothetical protein Q5P01_026000 [Channa striata]|uniref:C2H2-type domain-containing protein n=1 Tax=Channa striata TaxID=64152 RepID=A0AA88IFK2_CHASR|nr:hypothetical protein Q5P01_026000 [Channa striata]
MEPCAELHAQLASIMEVLANAAVSEICQLVDDGFASLRLEVSRSRRENLALRSRLRLMEVRAGERCLTGTDHHFREDGPAITRRKVKTKTLENSDSLRSQAVDVTEQLLEPEMAVIKMEMPEEVLTGCSVLEDPTADESSIGSQCLSPAAEIGRPLAVGTGIPTVSVSGQFEGQDLARLEKKGGIGETSILDQFPYPAEQSHRTTPRGSNRNLINKVVKLVVDPRNTVSAESSRSETPDVDTSLIKESEQQLANMVKVLHGATADWKGEAVSTPFKLEAEASWSEAFTTHNPSVPATRHECVSTSRLTNTAGEPGELDTNSLDSSSFDDLFSTLEVAQPLAAPHTYTGSEESLSSSVPFLRTSSNISSFINTSSDSTSRISPSSTERVFSCQQCSCLFSTHRDLVVHQRSHTGERIYHCHVCKKPFIHPHQLKTHQRVHTGEKPFSCTQCGKRFSQSSHIKRHMSVHTGEKRYSCSLCGKRFSQACSLKVHQAVHTGERPYSCTKCGKSFSVLGNLVRHQSVHISK